MHDIISWRLEKDLKIPINLIQNLQFMDSLVLKNIGEKNKSFPTIKKYTVLHTWNMENSNYYDIIIYSNIKSVAPSVNI